MQSSVKGLKRGVLSGFDWLTASVGEVGSTRCLRRWSYTSEVWHRGSHLQIYTHIWRQQQFLDCGTLLHKKIYCHKWSPPPTFSPCMRHWQKKHLKPLEPQRNHGNVKRIHRRKIKDCGSTATPWCVVICHENTADSFRVLNRKTAQLQVQVNTRVFHAGRLAGVFCNKAVKTVACSKQCEQCINVQARHRWVTLNSNMFRPKPRKSSDKKNLASLLKHIYIYTWIGNVVYLKDGLNSRGPRVKIHHHLSAFVLWDRTLTRGWLNLNIVDVDRHTSGPIQVPPA